MKRDKLARFVNANLVGQVIKPGMEMEMKRIALIIHYSYCCIGSLCKGGLVGWLVAYKQSPRVLCRLTQYVVYKNIFVDL